MRLIKNTRYYSKRIGKLTQGCKQCVRGQKLVLFITGKCPRKCWFCPLSTKKKNNKIIYANEWKINNFEKEIQNIFKEIELTQAKGIGITGGDPLLEIEKTSQIIQKTKQKYTKKFHIHLYTSLNLVNQNNLKQLHEAGLDEIRFHPDLENKKYWEKIKLAKNFNWEIGIEIPVIPHLLKNTKELIKYCAKHINFLNLNELEISENNIEEFEKYNYYPTNDYSSSIKNSWKYGQNLLFYSQQFNFNVHLCSSKLKDSIQLKNRLKRRAKNIATKFDKITQEGLLIRHIIKNNKNKTTQLLKTNKIEHQYDKDNDFILIHSKDIKKIQKITQQLKTPIQIQKIEQYPTWDKLIITKENL